MTIEELQLENEKLKNENDGLYYDIRMLNVKYDELNFEYEDLEFRNIDLDYEYSVLEKKCETAYRIANQYLMNQSTLEEVLDGIMLLKND